MQTPAHSPHPSPPPIPCHFSCRSLSLSLPLSPHERRSPLAPFRVRGISQVLVLKDFSIKPLQINSINMEHLEPLKSWLDSCNIKFYEARTHATPPHAPNASPSPLPRTLSSPPSPPSPPSLALRRATAALAVINDLHTTGPTAAHSCA